MVGMFEISRDLHFGSFALRTDALRTDALRTIALRTITLRTITLQTIYTSDRDTSDRDTSDRYISDVYITLRTTALRTTALRTTMSGRDSITHPCPFPLCTSHPFSRKHSLKNHLGAVIASGYDSKHPSNSPL